MYEDLSIDFPPKSRYGVQTIVRRAGCGYPTVEFHSDQAAHEEHGSGYNGYTATRHDDQFFLGKDILLAPIINQG